MDCLILHILKFHDIVSLLATTSCLPRRICGSYLIRKWDNKLMILLCFACNVKKLATI